AVIVQTRIDMSPDAMGEMASPLTPVPSNEPGVYSFKTDLAMQGRWLLSIAAKVQGEPETVVGKITFRATRGCHATLWMRDPACTGDDRGRGRRILVRSLFYRRAGVRNRTGECGGGPQSSLLPRPERRAVLVG